MENVRGSWWFKVDRAKRHLEEINAYIERFSDARPYRSARLVEGYSDLEFVVQAFLEDPPEYELATILGDFFYSLRSALDHIAVAFVPPDDRRKAAFPIFTEDPSAMEERDRRLNSWKRSTKAMTADQLAAIVDLQPYTRRPKSPELDHLAVLDSFAQADKHRELVTFSRYLRDPQTVLTWNEGMFSQFRPGTYANGEIVALFPLTEPIADSQVDVHVHGSVDVGLSRVEEPGDFVLPGTLGSLVDYIFEAVIPPLERRLP